jgi:hypothetical protein
MPSSAATPGSCSPSPAAVRSLASTASSQEPGPSGWSRPSGRSSHCDATDFAGRRARHRPDRRGPARLWPEVPATPRRLPGGAIAVNCHAPHPHPRPDQSHLAVRPRRCRPPPMRGARARPSDARLTGGSKFGCGHLRIDSGTGSERFDAHRLHQNHGLAVDSHYFARGLYTHAKGR